MSPAEEFLGAVIYSLGRAVTSEVLAHLVPLAKRALSSLPPLGSQNIRRIPSQRENQAPLPETETFHQDDISPIDAYDFVTSLMSMNAQQRRQLVRRAYELAQGDPELAMQNLIMLFDAASSGKGK